MPFHIIVASSYEVCKKKCYSAFLNAFLRLFLSDGYAFSYRAASRNVVYIQNVIVFFRFCFSDGSLYFFIT